jgi:PAS domain S-box-containing protein
MGSEKQYGKIIQNLLDAIYTCDEFGYLKLFNKAAAELWGREPEPGKDLYCGSYKIIGKDGTNLPLENYPMAITLKESKPIDNAEITIQRPDGSFRHILQSSTPIYNVYGKLTGVVNILIDVTNKNEE